MKFDCGTRVLLVYPNLSMSFALPHSIARLSGCLKMKGCEIGLFDTTLYKSRGKKSDDDIRVELGQFPHVDVPGIRFGDMICDFKRMVERFKPDVLMVSFVDNTVDIGMRLLHSLDSHVFTIAGGVGVIVNPVPFVGNPFIDMVWTGSAESLFGVSSVVEDFTVFESCRMYRPWSGKLFRTIPWHTGGCPYSCGFCCASTLRKKLGGNGFSMKYALDNLSYQIEWHEPKFVHITSESFLCMKDSDFSKFIKFYSKHNIPFWCQSHVLDIKPERIKQLKELNCFKIALGVECGDEEYRHVMVNKHFSNKQVKEAVRVVSDNGIRIGLNSIIGFPLETKSLMDKTLVLNKELYGIADGSPEVQINCYVFQPYHGTELRRFCRRHNLLRSDGVGSVNCGGSVLVNPFIDGDELNLFELDFVKNVKDL